MKAVFNLRDIIIDRYTPAKSRVQKLARPTCIAAQLLPPCTLGHTQLGNRKPNSGMSEGLKIWWWWGGGPVVIGGHNLRPPLPT